MTPPDHRPPGIVALWGLPGIGRRTLANKVIKNVLDFQRAIQINVEPGDTAADLRVKIVARYGDVKRPDAYQAEQERAEASSTLVNISTIVEYLAIAQANREAIILVDHGGMLNDEGAFYDEIREVIRGIFSSVDQRIVLVSRRKPEQILLEPGLTLPSIKIERLDEDGTRRLISQLAVHEKLSVAPQEIDTLVTRAKGYPPAAYYAIELVKEYGKDTVLLNGKYIVDYMEGAFLRLLENDNKFSDAQKLILSILPQFEELPLAVIGGSLSLDLENVDTEITKLVVLAVVSVNVNGYYCVADPVRDVTNKVFGRLNIPYGNIADQIDRFLEEKTKDVDLIEDIPLSLVRARYKAYVLSSKNKSGLFHMISDLANIQQELYHNQEYNKSIEIGLQALVFRPGQLDVLRYLSRAYTQIERYNDATDIIAAVKKKSMKEARTLEGFLQRKRGDMKGGAERYLEAIALGAGGAAIHRELGQCLFEEGDLKGAAEHLRQAHQADPDNKFVIDFEVQVAIAENRFADAEVLLEKLSRVEDESRVEHRRSTLYSEQGNLDQAYDAAKKALKLNKHPQFEMIAQLVTTAIRTRNLPDARGGLEQLSHRFKGIRLDIQNGLWARYYLATDEPEDAYSFWAKIANKSTIVHRRIGEDVIHELLKIPSLDAARKSRLDEELKRLRGG